MIHEEILDHLVVELCVVVADAREVKDEEVVDMVIVQEGRDFRERVSISSRYSVRRHAHGYYTWRYVSKVEIPAVVDVTLVILRYRSTSLVASL